MVLEPSTFAVRLPITGCLIPISAIIICLSLRAPLGKGTLMVATTRPCRPVYHSNENNALLPWSMGGEYKSKVFSHLL